MLRRGKCQGVRLEVFDLRHLFIIGLLSWLDYKEFPEFPV